MFSLFNKMIKKNQDEKDNKYENSNKNKKIIIHNIEDLKKISIPNKEKITTQQVPEIFLNKIEYELPETSIVDNEKIKKIIKNISNNEIIIPLGECNNDYYYESLESMPSLIIGGTVMSGKSSFVHTIIGTILLCKKPYETKLLICDSKKIEYNQYNEIPHLLAPIISDPKLINSALVKIIQEINRRIDLLNSINMKNINEYNKYISDKSKIVPSYIIIIDDYDMICNSIIDEKIAYIAKNGWKVNIYLIIVSTHPTTKVISSASKSLIPARICFKVISSKDSILILDDPIASKLEGFGQAAYVSRTVSIPKKLDVQILNDDEIKRLIEWAKSKQKIIYNELFSNLDDTDYNNKLSDGIKDDPLYDEVTEFVVKTQKVSASLIQRKFRISYNKATKYIEQLEKSGIIGPVTGNSNPREVLVQFGDEEE